MTKYNHYPKKSKPAQPPAKVRRQKLKISPACCIPVLMNGKPQYRKMLKSLDEIRGFLPPSGQAQLGQMAYMDELLADMEDFTPEIQQEQPPDMKQLLAQLQGGGNMTQTLSMLEALKRFQSSRDMTQLLPYLVPGQPMLSTLLPLLSGSDLTSLLPLFQGSDLSSLMPFLGGIR